MGTGSLDLNLSFSSFTMNTTTMITMDITRSQMLVEVIFSKITSRVCAKETLSFRALVFLGQVSPTCLNEHKVIRRWVEGQMRPYNF